MTVSSEPLGYSVLTEAVCSPSSSMIAAPHVTSTVPDRLGIPEPFRMLVIDQCQPRQNRFSAGHSIGKLSLCALRHVSLFR
jgi:hypothetical protein